MPNQKYKSNNKQIAKNTFFLYFRMMLIMAVSLYTSRIVLNALGVVDYGINNVVAGMVVMFSFLNSALAQASQRYIAYGIEKDSAEKQKQTFSMLLNVHILIAIVIFTLCETIGVWLFYNKLIIPAERMSSAFWVMQFSILSLMISVTQVPYNASIFGHERMNAYAYISIAEVLLKLGVVITIKYFFQDKLIAYGALTMGVSILTAFLYRIYCIKHFSYCQYIRYWSSSLFRELFSYTGWSLIGNLAWTFNSQGMNILINMFFGPVFNAARGIASSIEANVSSFLYNFTTPTIPPIIKSYATGNIEEMIKLGMRSSKFGFLLFMCLSLPLISILNTILNIWLISPPPYAETFCFLSLIYIQCNSLCGTLQNMVQATKRIKRYQLTNGLIKIMALPTVYIIYKCEGNVTAYLWTLIIFSILGLFAQLDAVKRVIANFKIKNYINIVILPSLFTYAIPFITAFYCYRITFNIIQAIGIAFINLIICICSVWFIGLSKDEKNWTVNIIRSKIHKIK